VTLIDYGAEQAREWSYAEACDIRELRRALIERFGHAVLSNLARRWLQEHRNGRENTEQAERTFSIGLAGGMSNTLVMILGWALTPQSARLIERALTLSYIGESRVAAFQDPSPTTEES